MTDYEKLAQKADEANMPSVANSLRQSAEMDRRWKAADLAVAIAAPLLMAFCLLMAYLDKRR